MAGGKKAIEKDDQFSCTCKELEVRKNIKKWKKNREKMGKIMKNLRNLILLIFLKIWLGKILGHKFQENLNN